MLSRLTIYGAMVGFGLYTIFSPLPKEFLASVLVLGGTTLLMMEAQTDG